jgi:glycerate kinase
MSLHILVMPDKFKGTLTATMAAEAVAEGWRRARPGDHLVLFPMSDGGDGFGELIGRAVNAEICWTDTVDAAHQPHRASWWWEPLTRTAIIEAAQVIGLALLPPEQYHPFELDTFGLGAVFQAVLDRGARRCLIGVGGSATNDGGFGLAHSLGWQFLDRAGQTIEKWTGLACLAHVLPPKNAGMARSDPAPLCEARVSSAAEFEVAVDVQNPLLGERGATRVYGPQKGLKTGDMGLAEACLQRLADVVRAQSGQDVSQDHGAGAGGGLGFGLRAFLQASLRPGFGLFAEFTQLDKHLDRADVVITGEGSIDASTWMGKGVGELVQRCQRRGLPCLGLAGVVAERDQLPKVFAQLHSLTPGLTTAESAKSRAAFWLARLAEQAAQGWV